MDRKNIFRYIFYGGYFLFVLFSFIFKFNPGIKIGENFLKFILFMIKIIPFAFILIGLFEVWVKKETVEKHLGESSGILAYFYMILLASTTAGGLYVAFPVAYSLYKKGARLSVIFTYVGLAAVCRIPMTIFEASFMGIKFTLIRFFVSIPLIIVSSIILEKYLLHIGFVMKYED